LNWLETYRNEFCERYGRRWLIRRKPGRSNKLISEKFDAVGTKKPTALDFNSR
jgi:hypothetical protein